MFAHFLTRRLHFQPVNQQRNISIRMANQLVTSVYVSLKKIMRGRGIYT